MANSPVPMNAVMQIDFEWLSSDAINSAERAGLAALAISINGKLATELEDTAARTVRPTARLGAHRLALWLVANWWRLRWEPQRNTLAWKMSHNIGAAGGGYAWPNLCFTSDGSTITAASYPNSTETGSPVRYLQTFEEVISPLQFEHACDHFVEAVIERVGSFNHLDSQLPALWSEVCRERSTPAQAAWRKLEALLGCDPDEAPASTITTLQGIAQTVGLGAVEEMAAATAADQAISQIKLLQHHQSDAIAATVPMRNQLRKLIDAAAKPALPQAPCQQAQHAAGLVRKAWGISPDAPIANKTFSELLGLSSATLGYASNGDSSQLAAGFRADANGQNLQVLLSKRPHTGRRFELARLIGDDLTANLGDTLLPVTRAKTARQKFQRAFAQELLCPYAALNDLMCAPPGDEDIDDAASYFDVSPLLVKTTLINRGRLPHNDEQYAR